MKQEMHEIEATLEIVKRISKVMKVTHEEYELLLAGDSSPLHKAGMMSDIEADADYEEDYTVYDLDTEKQVVDWR